MKNEIIDKLKEAGYITVTDDSQGIADKVGVSGDGAIDIDTTIDVPSYLKSIFTTKTDSIVDQYKKSVKDSKEQFISDFNDLKDSAKYTIPYGNFQQNVIVMSDDEKSQYISDVTNDLNDRLHSLPDDVEEIDSYEDPIPESFDLFINNPVLFINTSFKKEKLKYLGVTFGTEKGDLTPFVYGTNDIENAHIIPWPMQFDDYLNYVNYIISLNIPIFETFVDYAWDYDKNVLSNTENWSNHINWAMPTVEIINDPNFDPDQSTIPEDITRVNDDDTLRKIFESDKYNIIELLSKPDGVFITIDGVNYIISQDVLAMDDLISAYSPSDYYIEQIKKLSAYGYFDPMMFETIVPFYEIDNFKLPGFMYLVDGTKVVDMQPNQATVSGGNINFLSEDYMLDTYENYYKNMLTLDPTGLYYYEDEDKSKKITDPEKIIKVLRDMKSASDRITPNLDWTKIYKAAWEKRA